MRDRDKDRKRTWSLERTGCLTPPPHSFGVPLHKFVLSNKRVGLFVEFIQQIVKCHEVDIIRHPTRPVLVLSSIRYTDLYPHER